MTKILAAVLLSFATASWGQSYPNRAVRIIVPAGTGGPDIVARVVAAELQNQLGQPFVVENRPGANGIVVRTSVASPRPIATRSWVYSPGFVVNKFVHKSLPYDTEKASRPGDQSGEQRRPFFGGESVDPGPKLQEFIAYAKNPKRSLPTARPASETTGTSRPRCSARRSASR